MSAQTPRTPMPTPTELDAITAKIRQQYTIHIHHTPTRKLRAQWWATITHGIFHVGEPGADVWRARTRDNLLAKTTRWAQRNAASQGINPTITIDGARAEQQGAGAKRSGSA